jgi:putative ABC transport system substrate-binding protein
MSDNPVHPSQFEAIRTAADRVSLSALPFRVASIDDFDQGFSAMVAQKVDAFIPLGGAPLYSTLQQIDRVIALAAKARLPAVYANEISVRRGGLMSYGVNYPAEWKQAAVYVDRILKGVRPTDLPVQQPTSFELFVNRKTAANLGIKIPQALQLSAEFID